jgi:hypothetical protein
VNANLVWVAAIFTAFLAAGCGVSTRKVTVRQDRADSGPRAGRDGGAGTGGSGDAALHTRDAQVIYDSGVAGTGGNMSDGTGGKISVSPGTGGSSPDGTGGSNPDGTGGNQSMCVLDESQLPCTLR